jgi:23S rRNA pseudouridine1911/1915/1917 synthase
MIKQSSSSEESKLKILYEDDYSLVINKPASLLVHPAGGQERDTLCHWVSDYLSTESREQARPVHRLDKDTSGCILFVKSAKAQQLITENLKQGLVGRTYLAIAKGHINPSEGIIDSPIGVDPSNPYKRKIDQKGESAITHYKVVELLDDACLIELSLETGRTHQIRVHLNSLGHPLWGDSTYGGPKTFISRQSLHAWKLEFIHPYTKDKIKCEAALPEDIEDLIEILRA